MGAIIGIDLGTTNSEVAYINRRGKPEIIINKEGSRQTPSVVGVTSEKEIIVGDKAKRQWTRYPGNTVMEVKRLMGSDNKINLGDAEYRPQEISALILKYLKECAEAILGEPVTEAVITVPAQFDHLMRQATKDAGEIAGLKVERIFNEPTAAALAYGLENMGSGEMVLVYDLGGGTFDVSVLELFDGIFEVKASRGNNQLGGKDFDQRMMEFVYTDFLRKNHVDLRSLYNKEELERKIKEACERAKIELSFSDAAEIVVPYAYTDVAGSPIAINTRITRREFEYLITDLIQSTEECIAEALKAANLHKEEINVVLAVGGSTRIPCVKNLLKDNFGDKVKQDINPDEVVALGAAVQAGIKTDCFDGSQDCILTDICPFSLGTDVMVNIGGGQTMPGVFDCLIKRDTVIPTTEKKMYVTANDNQSMVRIGVFQGEEILVDQNTLIGEFFLEGIPQAPAGEQGVEVAFSYDINGILQVDAVIASNGKMASITIDTKSMNKEEVEAATARLQTDWRKSSLVKKVEAIINSAERKMDNLDPESQIHAQQILGNLKTALIEENDALVDKYDDELTELLFEAI